MRTTLLLCALTPHGTRNGDEAGGGPCQGTERLPDGAVTT